MQFDGTTHAGHGASATATVASARDSAGQRFASRYERRGAKGDCASNAAMSSAL
jgi:hypothetical protein